MGIKLVAHDAIGDILFMKMLLSQMTKDVKKQFNIENCGEAINKMIELSSQKVLISKFKFGKHNGKFIKDVVIDDTWYINWIMKNPIDDEDLMFTVEYWMKNRNKLIKDSKSTN